MERGMIRRIFKRFAKRRQVQLMVARDIADKELQRAVLSGDTRRINASRKAMMEATHAQMRAELGWKC